jgi:ABC-type glycerol-3-phosphate transport system substrate-binding protein
MKKWFLILFAALSLSLAVTGCSGTEDEESDTDTEQNEDTGTESDEGTEEESE